jgi:hypothetical protein
MHVSGSRGMLGTLGELIPERSGIVQAASRLASQGADRGRTGQENLHPLTNNSHLTLRIMYATTTFLRDSISLQKSTILAPLQ